MVKRGRKVGSLIRDRLVELLFYLEKDYGYNIFKYYCKIYGKVTLRSIYYHLKKGKELEIFKINKIEEVNGDYSWGPKTQRIIYSLGPNAKPKGDKNIEKKLKTL